MARRRRGPTMIQRSRRKSASEKAAYHQVTGAGRSRVKRPFFGLDDRTEDAIFDKVERFVIKALKRRFRAR